MKIEKRCEECGQAFQIFPAFAKTRRFCSRPCAYRNPARKDRASKSLSRAWDHLSPEQRSAMNRGKNKMHDPAVRAKLSQTLRRIGHRPPVRGGNGQLTRPQKRLWLALGRDEWKVEHGVGIRPWVPGYPRCYKVDLALPSLKVAVEVDGLNHRNPKNMARDRKKEAKLMELGWRVFRLSNAEILADVSKARRRVLVFCGTLR